MNALVTVEAAPTAGPRRGDTVFSPRQSFCLRPKAPGALGFRPNRPALLQVTFGQLRLRTSLPRLSRLRLKDFRQLETARHFLLDGLSCPTRPALYN